MSVGDEFVVVAMLIEPDSTSPWVASIQLLDPEKVEPSWWPLAMFETTSTQIPSNWTAHIWPDGSLHVAPESWLQHGFWEAYFDRRRSGPAAETFAREVDIILRES